MSLATGFNTLRPVMADLSNAWGLTINGIPVTNSVFEIKNVKRGTRLDLKATPGMHFETIDFKGGSLATFALELSAYAMGTQAQMVLAYDELCSLVDSCSPSLSDAGTKTTPRPVCVFEYAGLNRFGLSKFIAKDDGALPVFYDMDMERYFWSCEFIQYVGYQQPVGFTPLQYYSPINQSGVANPPGAPGNGGAGQVIPK
jgi:hypothetical protein